MRALQPWQQRQPARLSSYTEAATDEDDAADGIASLGTILPEGSGFVPARGRLGPCEPDWIGRELREYYGVLLREPVPDRLLALIDRNLACRILR